MFQITFFVEDHKLGEAFKRLAGVARDLKHQYVPNVELANGKAKVMGDVVDLFMREAHNRKLSEFKASEARSIVESIGLAGSSYSHVLGKVREAGFITAKALPKGKGAGLLYILKGK